MKTALFKGFLRVFFYHSAMNRYMFAYVSSRLPTFLFLHYFISALSCYEKGSKRKSHLYPFTVFFYKSLD